MDKNILLVEDDWKLRRVAADVLKAQGYNVFEAEDGEEALEIYYKKKIDLAILDIMLPKIDGWSVCQEIRLENKELPIIMLTAKGEEEDILKGYELETDEYIAKPVSLKILVAKIKALLKRNAPVETLVFEELTINTTNYSASLDGKDMNLSPRK